MPAPEGYCTITSRSLLLLLSCAATLPLLALYVYLSPDVPIPSPAAPPPSPPAAPPRPPVSLQSDLLAMNRRCEFRVPGFGGASGYSQLTCMRQARLADRTCFTLSQTSGACQICDTVRAMRPVAPPNPPPRPPMR